MTRAIGLVLTAPLLGFALEAALGAGQFQFHLRAWGQTLIVAGGATVLAVAFGIPVALVLAHSNRPLLRTLTLFPLLLPPVLAAAAWMGAGLPAPGPFGCAAILGALTWPVVALLLEASLRRIPADALDAAAIQLTPARTARVVIWPHVRPALGAAALLVFLLAASEFTVPALFVVPTISMTIYEQMSAFRIASAASAATPLIALAVGLAWAMRRMEMIPPSRAARPFLFGAPLTAARGVAGVLWIATAILPALLFARRAGSFFTTLSMNLEAVAWSGGIAAATALLLVAWSALSTQRSRLEPFWLATLALPGIVAGLGAMELARRTHVLPWLAPSGALLGIALMARFAFAAWLPLREPVDPRQLEAAELSGLSPVRTWWKITAPAVLPRAGATAAVVFVLALGEIGPVVLLSPPGRLTASQHLFNLMHYGYDGVVASLALFLFGAAALVTWSGMHVGRLGTNRLA